MSVLKLTDAGQSHTGKIETAQRVEGNFGAQVCLTFEDGNSVYLPEESADRQLNRIGYTVEELNEQASETAVWLKVHRQANPKKGAKPFWAIDKASGRASLAPSVPPSRTATPKSAPKATSPGTSLTGIYLHALEFVLDEVAQRMNAAAKVGMVEPLLAADVIASTATIYISATQHLLPETPIFGPPTTAPKSFGGDPGPSDDDYPGDFEEAV